MKRIFALPMNFPAVLVLMLAAITTTVQAQTYTQLYAFPETNRNNTGIGWQMLAQGRDGNFYSTITNGGANSGGSAYMMTPAGQYTDLYDFCPLSGCADGQGPEGGVALGFDGNFYGTTVGGGTRGAGTVFAMTPSGAETSLYKFLNQTDDSAPAFTVQQAQDGSLYGVSEAQYNGQYGSFFRISTAGVFKVIHDFAYTDGAVPNIPTQGTDGNFYGTAQGGGDPTCKCGVVYKLTPSGSITVLHPFTGYPTDGYLPIGPLVQASDGNFYGTTYKGGTYNLGTIFKVSSSGAYTVLYNFGGVTNDGRLPYAGVTQASDGNFYGTTLNGGTKNAGVIFQMTSAGAVTNMYSFCDPTCQGFGAEAPIVQHTSGKLYGLTSGNSLGGGVFYSLDMGLKPIVNLLNWQGKVNATVEILGQGFTGTTKVSFNGTPATFNNISDTYMTATVPAGATTGQVTVQTFTTTMKSNRKFLVTPQIFSLSANSGPVGTPITITGMSLSQTKGVGFGDTKPAKFTVISDTEVQATPQEGAKSGWVGIQTPGGIVTFGNFLVIPGNITFSPDHGPVGTQVTIRGTTFNGATQVTFGNGAAKSYQVINDTEIKALVPSDATTGPISVTTPSGTGTSQGIFTVTQ